MANRNFLVVISFVITVIASALLLVESIYMTYNTTASIVPEKLNIHLVPHTHNDVGWLKTVDQYYIGSNNSIQGGCVKNILDSLIPALLADRNRKFIYAEQAFFQRWWRDQSMEMQMIVRKLVKSGQLEFVYKSTRSTFPSSFSLIPYRLFDFCLSCVMSPDSLDENGGWCMHDEATTHYIDMIDQTTLGHRYIKEQFNVTPRIGWQIDTFGHSAVQAYLLGAEVGFDSLFFARIDYQDRAARKDQKSLEVVWRGSKTFASSTQIFTGTFLQDYGPPTGFNFEINDSSDIVQDDSDLFDYNVQNRVNDFVAAALAQANVTLTNHIMWTMGTDFTYQYADSWYRNMDKLIHYVNEDGRVNVLYSTPSVYTDAKYESKEPWSLKNNDYFPYAEYEHAYYTGYFTSRPAIKGYVRLMSGYYLAARQLEYLKGKNEAGPTTDSLGDALAIAQHHDAVSGTELQHVANDYAKRLSIGHKEAETVVSTSLSCIVESKRKSGCKNTVTKLKQCPLLNISYCPPSEVKLSPQRKVVVVVYNSLGWKRTEIVRVPVTTDSATILDSSGKEIQSQMLPVLNASLVLRKLYVTANVGKSPSSAPLYWLAFMAEVPPLGFNTYVISSGTGAVSSVRQTIPRSDGNQSDVVEVGPGNLKLTFSGNEGRLLQYHNSRNSVKSSLEQSYTYYAEYDATNDAVEYSEAYVFRPNGSYPIQSQSKTLTVFRGPLFDEIHQSLTSWIYQITRLYKEKEHVEVEFIVGPIPIDDAIGKEVVTELKTTINNNRTFYTDSNGRDFLERIQDFRSDWDLQVNEPVSGNYYPISLGTYIKDKSIELSVLVDRPVGGSSIVDGHLELMLHRRLLGDRGLGEALNETVCIPSGCSGLTVQGKYYYRIDPLGDGAKWRRTLGQEIYFPLLLAFTEQVGDVWENFDVRTFTGIDPSYSLPENVAMITLQELPDGNVLLRLAHLYEAGEDKDLSRLSNVELKRLFPDKKISKVTEMSLSANQKRQDMEKKRFIWKTKRSKSHNVLRGKLVDPVKLEVQLAPMEIRTFIIQF